MRPNLGRTALSDPNAGEFHQRALSHLEWLGAVWSSDLRIARPRLPPVLPDVTHLLTFIVNCAVWSQGFGHKQFIFSSRRYWEKKGSNLEENDMWAHCIHADAQIQQVVNFGEQSFGL